MTWASEDEFKALQGSSCQGAHHLAVSLLDEATYSRAVEDRRYDSCRQLILDPTAAAANPALAQACARRVEIIERQRERERRMAAERQAEHSGLAEQRETERREQRDGTAAAAAGERRPTPSR